MFTWEEYQKKSGRLLPRYALTKGLTNQTVQKSVAQALEYYPPEKEYLPQSVLQKYPCFPTGKLSIHCTSRKTGRNCWRQGTVSYSKNSFFYWFFGKIKIWRRRRRIIPMYETADTVRFLEQLPFSLTKAQKKVWELRRIWEVHMP